MPKIGPALPENDTVEGDEKRGSLWTISRYLRHKSIRTTENYLRRADSSLVEAAEILETPELIKEESQETSN